MPCPTPAGDGIERGPSVRIAGVVLSAVLTADATARLARRVAALRSFRLAILVSLLLGLPLALFDDPALATGGLLVGLVCLGVFTYGSRVEPADGAEQSPADDGLQPGVLGAPLDGPG